MGSFSNRVGAVIGLLLRKGGFQKFHLRAPAGEETAWHGMLWAHPVMIVTQSGLGLLVSGSSAQLPRALSRLPESLFVTQTRLVGCKSEQISRTRSANHGLCPVRLPQRLLSNHDGRECWWKTRGRTGPPDYPNDWPDGWDPRTITVRCRARPKARATTVTCPRARCDHCPVTLHP